MRGALQIDGADRPPREDADLCVVRRALSLAREPRDAQSRVVSPRGWEVAAARGLQGTTTRTHRAVRRDRARPRSVVARHAAADASLGRRGTVRVVIER